MRVAHRIDPTRPWREVVERLREDTVPAAGLLDSYRAEVTRAHRFLLERDLVRVPDGPLEVLDTPDRRSLLWVPMIALGRLPDPPERRGFHRLTPEAFEMELDAPFILDGEAFPPGRYRVSLGPVLRFAAP